MMKNPFEAAAICIANLAFAFAFYNVFCRLLDQGIREMDRKQKLRRILCYLVFYISNTFLGLAHIHGLRKAAVFLLSLFLCALIGHRGRMENKVSICLTSGGYALLVEMLSGYLAAFVFRIVPGDLLNRELHGVFVMVISRGLLLGSSFGVSAVAARLETANTVKYVGTLLMMPLCSIIIIVCVVMDNVAEMRFVDYLHDYVLAVSLILILFTNVGLLFLLNRIYRQSIDRSKLQHLEQQRQLYMETMEIQKQSQSEMEKYRHDVKNLYLGLDNCIATGRFEEARAMLKKELDIVYQSRRVMNTGDTDLDCLLNHKISLASSKGIGLEAQVKIMDPIQMEMRDLYILVGNMLDNAIEAVQKLPEEGKIMFCLESSKGILFIKESNEFEGNLVRKGFGFATTKEEGEKHGYGINNMEAVVRKYNGKLYVHTKGQEFIAEAYVYYHEK